MKRELRSIAAAALLIGGGPLLAAETDVVNERIPVSGKELERQWRVDCSALIASFNRAVAGHFAAAAPDAIEHMRHDATLCGFIYQINRKGKGAACPDYQRIAQFVTLLTTDSTRSAAIDWDAAAVTCE